MFIQIFFEKELLLQCQTILKILSEMQWKLLFKVHFTIKIIYFLKVFIGI
jgi:hypothetical protein